jgi:hypothetical protein
MICKLIVALATPSLPGDLSAQVFLRSFYDQVLNLLKGRLAADVQFANRLGAELGQHALTVWSDGILEGRGHVVRVGRFGSVAVGFSNPDLRSGLSLAADHASSLRDLWISARQLLQALGGYGPVFVVVRLRGGDGGETEIARLSSLENDPLDEELASVSREAQRTRGSPAWEPER